MYLCEACKEGDLSRASQLVRDGCDLEERSDYEHRKWKYNGVKTNRKSKCTPLMIASSEGHLDIVRELIRAEANVHVKDRDDWVALHFACSSGSLEIVRLLLDNGCRLEEGNDQKMIPLVLAAFFGHSHVISEILESYKILEKDLLSALHWAYSRTQVNCVEILLPHVSLVSVERPEAEAVKSDLSVDALMASVGEAEMWLKDFEEKQLCRACRAGNVNTVKELIREGYTLEERIEYVHNDWYQQDDYKLLSKYPPLMIASFEGHLDIAEMLVSAGALLEAQDSRYGQTALHCACINGSLGIVHLLLANNVLIDVPDICDSITPLHLAAYFGQIEVLSLLLKRGANFGAKSKSHGRTALHWACHNGKLDCIGMLLDAGSAINVCDDDDDWTPLILAAVCGHKEVLSLLLKRGANVDAKSKKLGRTALHFACQEGKLDYVGMLLDAGSAINVCDDDEDCTPLILAAVCGHKEVLSLLLKRGANFGAKSKSHGRTALHWACQEVKLDCVEMLLDAGSAINVCDDEDDLTPLILAAFYGQKEVLSLLLKRGANVDAKSKKLGRTALHWACQGGKLDCVEMLLDAGSAINVCDDDDDWTPLILAAVCGQKEVLSLLLKRGAIVDAKSKSHGRTALHFACQEGKLDYVGMLLDAGSAINVCDDEDDWTPLILAALCGQKEVLSLLLKRGAIVDAKSKIHGRTALHFACQEGKLDYVGMLLDAGSAINVCDDEDDLTPLILAAFYGQKEVLSLLLKRGANVDAKSKKLGRTALHWACRGGKLDCVEMLLDAGSAINVCDDEDDLTPLILAAFYGQKEVLSLLLKRGAIVDAKSKSHGRTALHWACQGGKLDCVEMLLDAGSAINVCDDEDDLTPLILAAFYGQKEVLSLLLKRGAIVDAKSKSHGRTALHLACQGGKLDCVEMLLDAGSAINVCDDEDDLTPLILAAFYGQIEVLSLLLKRGAIVDAKSKSHGRTALHWACQGEKLDCVEMLLDAGSAINVCDDEDDLTPLILAVFYGQKEVLSLLLKRGAIVDAKSKNHGRTALHLACQEGKLDYVGMLLDAGSAINVCDDDEDCTPLILAAVCGHKEVLSLLLKRGANFGAKSKSHGRTALHFACQEGKLDCVEMLLDAGSAINVCDDDDDWTPLILAAVCGQIEVLSLLLKRGANFGAKSKSHGRTALHWACQEGKLDCVEAFLVVLIIFKPAVIGNRLGTVCHQTTHFSNFLVLTDKQGLTPFHLAFRSNHINIVKKLIMYSCGLKLESLEQKTISQLPLLKKKTIEKTIVYTESLRKVVCLIGNSKSGKSTLVSALQNEPKNIFERITGRMYSVETITDRTAGIEMANFESIIFGETLFFDFAGQHEYHGAHQAILKSLLTRPGVSLSIIIIVKLTDKEDAMLVQMTRWLQPLSWIVSSDVVHVNVVGSFADKVERSEALPKLERCCQTLQNDNQYSNLKFDNFVCLDCRKPVSSDIETLRNSLRDNTPPPILPKRPYNIHWVLSLLSTTINLPIISMQEFEKWLNDYSVDLPINLPKVDILSQELSATGNVLYISGQKDKSWLVIKLSHVLHDIYGQLYSRFQAIANNKFGLLHIKQLEELLHKSDLDIDAIVNLLISLDFCHLVDPRTLKDEIYHLTSTRDESGWLFFPSFITAKPDLEMFWRANQDSCSLCWQVSTSEKQFFSPQLLQTVLLRLAANHVFKHERTQSIQDHCCNFWYNGITWQTTDGVDVMVHIFENTVAQVIAVIPRKVDPSVLVRYMSSVTTEILYTVHQLYPKLVPYLEAFIIHTMDCKKLCDDPKSASPSDKFLLSSIITSVIDNKQFCLSLKEESGYSKKREVTELFKGFRPSPEVLHSMNPHTICIRQDHKRSVLENATANSNPSISFESDKVERTSSNKGKYVMTFVKHLILLDNDVISFRVNCSY